MKYEVFMTRDDEGTDEKTWHRVEVDAADGGLLATAQATVDRLNASGDGHSYELRDAHRL